MNEQIERNRMELVLALRSGRYEQCYFNFFDTSSMCVAGLGMKLFNIRDTNGSGSEMDSALAVLCEKLNIDKGWRSKEKSGIWNISHYNDYGKTFPELADILVKDYGFPDVQVFQVKGEEVLHEA